MTKFWKRVSKGKRKPITNAKANGFRLCSMPNDLWQLQRDMGFRGIRDRDPWEGVFRPTTLDQATRQLQQRATP